MLNGKSYIDGEGISIADINIMFAVKWALVDLAFGQRQGFRSQDLPNIYRWYVISKLFSSDFLLTLAL